MAKRIGVNVLPAGPPSEASAAKRGRLFPLIRQKVTPRLGAALVVWRLEARLGTPIALALVAALGRWPAALAVGAIMGVLAALFLFLLDGERAMEDLRAWVRQRSYVRRYILPIAERRDRRGAVQRALLIPVVVLFLGPFQRAVAFHLFRVPRPAAFVLSVGGSIPHSLLWTGLVLGGIWEALLWPLLKDRLA